MRRPPWLLTCTLALSLLALSLLGGTVRADDLSVPPLPPAKALLGWGGAFPAPPPPPPPSLAQALAALPPPTQDLYLSVGADKVSLPPGAPPPDPDSRPREVGVAYGRLARDFGGVTALAPPEMVVLNPSPGVPRPFDGMPPTDALKLLLAGLTPPQWAALTGPSGLGLADLSDDAQRALFHAALPSGDVKAYPQAGGPPPSSPQDPIPLTAQDLRAARLRLGQQTEVFLPVEGEPNITRTYPANFLLEKTPYRADESGSRPARDTLYGAVLRETLPNSPKDADLDYDAPALTQSVRLDGVATVGELVARVGKSAGLDLYADRRYERRTVTLVGRRTARGKDLLRAVAFCVTGTFRRVGPAYVLTDDREGTAPRRQRLARFVQEAEMARHAALTAAGDSLITTRGGVDALPPLDGLGLSDAQKALPEHQQHNPTSMVRVPFALLTPAQREYAADQLRQGNEQADQAERTGGVRVHRPTLAGQFQLSSRAVFLLLSPAVPGPITLPSLNAASLYEPSPKLQQEIWRRQMEEAAKTTPLRVLSPALAAALAPFPRRAVLAAPRTAGELDSVIASMKALGLNQLWLDVFSGGHSALDRPAGEGSPLAPNSGGTGKASSSLTPPELGAGGPDFLTEALARTKGTGIAVLPALDLLRWGADAPAEACDLTVLGETSAQAAAWQQRYTNVTQDIQPQFVRIPSPDVWACPAAPATEAALLALVRRLAATPGVATLVLRGTVPPGYAGSHGLSDDDLGYVPALRLALLRRDHVDPLDLDAIASLPGGADVSLPGFDDWNATGTALGDWNTLRDGVSRDLLRRLLAAAQEAGGRRLRFLVRQRGSVEPGGWYGLWDNPVAPLPEVPLVPQKPGAWPPPSPWEINYAPAAHSQSRIALYALPSWAGASPSTAADMLRKLKPGWDGVALDATDLPPGVPGGDMLADLARGAAR